MFRISVFLKALAIVVVTSDQEHIPGGEDATINDHPYLAEILGVDFKHICAGVIISENHVLTSSNCLGPSFVRVGSDKKNQGGRVNGIINFTSHDTYDLMLIQLKQPIKFNDKVRSIRLLDAELPENSVGWIVGYGQGDQLQKSMIPIVDKKVCEKIYEEQWGIKLRPRTICGGYHGRGGISPCSGDLGGPLMVNERLAGVISRATSCDDPYTLGFYTEIAQFRRWIEEYTKVSF